MRNIKMKNAISILVIIYATIFSLAYAGMSEKKMERVLNRIRYQVESKVRDCSYNLGCAYQKPREY